MYMDICIYIYIYISFIYICRNIYIYIYIYITRSCLLKTPAPNRLSTEYFELESSKKYKCPNRMAPHCAHCSQI